METNQRCEINGQCTRYNFHSRRTITSNVNFRITAEARLKKRIVPPQKTFFGKRLSVILCSVKEHVNSKPKLSICPSNLPCKCLTEVKVGNIFSLSHRKSVQFFLSCIYIITTAKFAVKIRFFYRKSKFLRNCCKKSLKINLIKRNPHRALHYCFSIFDLSYPIIWHYFKFAANNLK